MIKYELMAQLAVHVHDWSLNTNWSFRNSIRYQYCFWWSKPVFKNHGCVYIMNGNLGNEFWYHCYIYNKKQGTPCKQKLLLYYENSWHLEWFQWLIPVFQGQSNCGRCSLCISGCVTSYSRFTHCKIYHKYLIIYYYMH